MTFLSSGKGSQSRTENLKTKNSSACLSPFPSMYLYLIKLPPSLVCNLHYSEYRVHLFLTLEFLERPTQSFIALFLSSAIIFVSIQIVIPKSMFTSKTLNGVSSTTLRRRTSIPNSRESSPKPTNPPVTPNSNLRRLSFVAAALVLCLRIEIFRLSLGVRQCLLSGIEVS